jgi:NADH dehydrogenase FAD-containing subunit
MDDAVVVVGGGYAGIMVASALDPHAEVVLVDPRDAFLNVAASLRSLTQPDWAHNAFFSYERLLPRGRFVRDWVVSVDPTGVTLGSGDRIDADFIVLATGSSYPYPAHPRRIEASAAEATSDLRATHEQLEDADRVLILGAGPVGLELAGEIREVWPDKHVTVLGRGAEILPAYLPEVREDLRRQLEALGVDLRLGTGLVRLPEVEEGRAGDFVVETDDGEEIGADIWFRAFGSRPSTDYLADGALIALTPRSTVPVTGLLNVVGHDRVYALGDIVDLPDPKMATWAQTQAPVVIDNVKAQIEGREPEVTYAPGTSQRIFLPLGTRGGVGQLPGPDGVAAPAPLETVVERKGRDLFTAKFAERFGSA